MIEVVAAVIVFQGKLLAFQRGPAKYEYVSKKYEFPGGKIEPGEGQREALKRELFEELGLEADVRDFIVTIDHAYPDFELKMHCYLVNIEHFSGQLTEHLSFAHVGLKDASELDWIEADKPVLEILNRDFTSVLSV